MRPSKNLCRPVLASIVAAFVLGAAASAEARDFTYAGWGGGLEDTQREVYLKDFTQKTGKPFKEDTYLGGWADFETMQQSGNVKWDVVNVESAELQRGCDEGVFLSLGYGKIGTPQSAFTPGTATTCGIGSYVWAFAIAYNSEATKTPPKSFADFWDLKTWPGKRGLRKGPHFNLELALLADGVPSKDVYKTLATPEGVDRAFKKLDAIKANVLWWEAPAQAVEQLASGNVELVVAPNARISDAAKSGKPFKIVYNPGMVGTDFWVILKNSPMVDQAYDFLKVATNVDNQAKFSSSFAYAPTVAAAAQKLSPQVAEALPVGPAVADALDVSSNEANQFWADNGDALNERWNAWLAK